MLEPSLAEGGLTEATPADTAPAAQPESLPPTSPVSPIDTPPAAVEADPALEHALASHDDVVEAHIEAHLEVSAEAHTAAEAAVPVAPEMAEQERQIKTVVSSILDYEADEFTEALGQSGLQELVLLMEDLAQREIVRTHIRQAGLIKKQFDELYAKALSDLNAQADDDEHPELAEEAKQTKERNLAFSQRLSKALITFNRRRHEYELAQSKEREENLVKKRELLEGLKAIVMAEDLAAIDKVRSIQSRWRELGQVPLTEVNNLMQSYRAYLDQFYGMREKYKELLEQDRKVNLEEKEKLIAEVEALAATLTAESSARAWQEAADRIKLLHDNWKAIGPVPREHTEPIWQRFKLATDAFYGQRRGFFELRDEQRTQNTEKKKELVERARPYLQFASDHKEAWMGASRELQTMMEAWKQVGPALQKEGKALFKEFRDIQNSFYKRRSQYFNQLNAQRGDLVLRKEALLAEAEAVAVSDDKGPSAERLKQLQREWRQTGPDDYKEARKLQKRFRKVCDTFFNQLKAQIADEHKGQEDNLNRKQALLDQIEALLAAEAPGTEAIDQAADLMHEVENIGHVPIKQKDRINGRIRAAQNLLFTRREPDPDKRRKLTQNAKYQAMAAHPGADYRLDKEERRLIGRLRQIEEVVKQYENNILFIAKGKKGDSLRNEITVQLEQARAEEKRVRAELKALRTASHAKPHEAPAKPAENRSKPAEQSEKPIEQSAPAEPSSVEPTASAEQAAEQPKTDESLATSDESQA